MRSTTPPESHASVASRILRRETSSIVFSHPPESPHVRPRLLDLQAAARRRHVRRQRFYIILSTLFVAFTLFLVSVASFNCSYFRKGLFCNRPGMALSARTPFAEWLRVLDPPSISFSEWCPARLANISAASSSCPADQAPSRTVAHRIEAAVHERLSRSWESISKAADEEDDRAAKGSGSGAVPAPDAGHVPFYLRYLTALRQQCDPSGNHYTLSSLSPPPRPARVRFATVTNRKDFALCGQQASASLSGVPTAVLGMEAKYDAVKRYATVLDFAVREGLEDHDILMYIDSDAFYTGEDVVPFLEKFIRLSPASEADLDVSLVRAWEDYGEFLAPRFADAELLAEDGEEGTTPPLCARRRSLLQLPPILANTERYCFAGDSLDGEAGCRLAYGVTEAVIEQKRNRNAAVELHPRPSRDDLLPPWLSDLAPKVRRGCYGTVRCFAGDVRLSEAFDNRSRFAHVTLTAPASDAADGSPPRDAKDPFFYHRNTNANMNAARYLNSGGLLTRVWALRKLVAAMHTYSTTHQPKIWKLEKDTKRSNPKGYARAHALAEKVGSRAVLVEFLAKEAGVLATKGKLAWVSDQSVLLAIFLASRMWEGEQGLLRRRVTRHYSDSQGWLRAAPANPYGGIPAGLIGLDRRSEFFFVTSSAVQGEHFDLVDDYHARVCGAGRCSGTPSTAARHSRSGAVLTQPLIRVFLTEEDLARRLYVLKPSSVGSAALLRRYPWMASVTAPLPPLSSDATSSSVTAVYERWPTVYNIVPSLEHTVTLQRVEYVQPAMMHLAGGWKDMYFQQFRHVYPWFSATRSGNSSVLHASQKILDGARVELWATGRVHVVPYTPFCGYPFWHH